MLRQYISYIFHNSNSLVYIIHIKCDQFNADKWEPPEKFTTTSPIERCHNLRYISITSQKLLGTALKVLVLRVKQMRSC